MPTAKVPKKTTKSASRKYEDRILFEVYELAANGLTKPQIADAFKIEYRRLKRWQKVHPLIKTAYEQGKATRQERSGLGDKPTETIEQYVYKRLNPALVPIWNKLKSLDKEPNSAKRIEALLQDKGKLVRQQLFLHALVSRTFRVADALRICNLSYGELKTWKLDSQFGQLLDEVSYYKNSFVEGKLMEAVERGEPWAVQMAAKGLIKETYGEQSTVKIEGKVDMNHQHDFVPIEKLSLPVRKIVMKELEAAKIEDAEYTVKS